MKGELEKRLQKAEKGEYIEEIASEMVSTKWIRIIIEEARKDFPRKEHFSKVYGTAQNYDEWNLFGYKDYDTGDLESCQKLIKAYEEAVRKWFGTGEE